MTKGWKAKTLGEICLFENGDRGENYPSKSVQTTSGVPFINAGHLSESGIDFSEMNYIPRERFKLLGNGKIQKDDILFCLRGSLGKFASVGSLTEGAIASSLVIIRPGGAILNKFVLAYLQSDLCAEMIGKFRNGAAQPNLAAASLKKFSIPVPPLPDQRRIVGILDEAFSSIATAKANTEKNLQNARAIFESHLQSVFSQRGSGWVAKPLGDIAEFKNGLNYSKNSSGQTLPMVGVSDFQDNYFVPLSKLESATIDGKLAKGYALKQNDILTVRSNGSKHLVGRCMLVGDVDEVVSYSGFIIRIRFDTSKVFPKFVLHFMKCQATRDTLTRGGGGTNITNINQEKLSSLLVPLPAYETQTEVAAALDALHEECQRLISLHRRKLGELDALKKSLLHDAFTGQLKVT